MLRCWDLRSARNQWQEVTTENYRLRERVSTLEERAAEVADQNELDALGWMHVNSEWQNDFLRVEQENVELRRTQENVEQLRREKEQAEALSERRNYGQPLDIFTRRPPRMHGVGTK